jgi:YD repeat-containing protein
MRLTKRWSVFLACLSVALPAVATAQQEAVDEQGGEITREVADDGAESDVLLDEEGRVIAERQPDGTIVRYLYDGDGVRHVVED